jgi:hypothetical protein
MAVSRPASRPAKKSTPPARSSGGARTSAPKRQAPVKTQASKKTGPKSTDSTALSSEAKNSGGAGASKSEDASRVDSITQGLWDTASIGFNGWDANKDKFLTNNEIERALKNKNLSPEKKAALETLRGRQSQLEEKHNDEYLDENNGISRDDLRATRNEKSQDTRIMEEQYKIEHGLATEPESVKKKAAANPDSPADLRDKIGTHDYYAERYKDFRRRNPSEKAPDYYMNYGLKYFDRFSELKPDVSSPTKKWIDKTAVKLQEKMEAPNTRNGKAFANMERSPEKFKEFAYGTHPSAYLEGGLANVPINDLRKIPFVPDVKDLATPDGVAQGVETGIGYGKIQGKRAIQTGKVVGGVLKNEAKRRAFNMIPKVLPHVLDLATWGR